MGLNVYKTGKITGSLMRIFNTVAISVLLFRSCSNDVIIPEVNKRQYKKEKKQIQKRYEKDSIDIVNMDNRNATDSLLFTNFGFDSE